MTLRVARVGCWIAKRLVRRASVANSSFQLFPSDSDSVWLEESGMKHRRRQHVILNFFVNRPAHGALGRTASAFLGALGKRVPNADRRDGKDGSFAGEAGAAAALGSSLAFRRFSASFPCVARLELHLYRFQTIDHVLGNSRDADAANRTLIAKTPGPAEESSRIPLFRVDHPRVPTQRSTFDLAGLTRSSAGSGPQVDALPLPICLFTGFICRWSATLS